MLYKIYIISTYIIYDIMPKFLFKNHTIIFTLYTDIILSPCYSIYFKILNHQTNQVYKTKIYSSDYNMSDEYFATIFYDILINCFIGYNNNGYKIKLSTNDKQITLQLYIIKFFCIKYTLYNINLKLKY